MALTLTARGKRVWRKRIRSIVRFLITMIIVSAFSGICAIVLYGVFTGTTFSLDIVNPIVIHTTTK